MTTPYSGNAASGARSPAVSVNVIADGDTVNAAISTAAPKTLADFVAWLQAHAAIFDDANTFSAAQVFAALVSLNANNLALTKSGDQSVLKSGSGKLQLGSSIAADVELLVGGNARAVLSASTGVGLTGTGAVNSYGLQGNGTGNGHGVVGSGGITDAAGVVGQGGGRGIGVAGQGGSSGGVGVQATAGGSERGALSLVPQSAPSAPANGDMWVETGTNALKVRINGVTKTVTLT